MMLQRVPFAPYEYYLVNHEAQKNVGPSFLWWSLLNLLIRKFFRQELLLWRRLKDFLSRGFHETFPIHRHFRCPDRGHDRTNWQIYQNQMIKTKSIFEKQFFGSFQNVIWAKDSEKNIKLGWGCWQLKWKLTGTYRAQVMVRPDFPPFPRLGSDFQPETLSVLSGLWT